MACFVTIPPSLGPLKITTHHDQHHLLLLLLLPLRSSRNLASTMFDHFTFGTYPHTLPPSTQDEALSPTDTSFPPAAASKPRSGSYVGQQSGLGPREGISEIVQRFEQQSLQGHADPRTDDDDTSADASTWIASSPTFSIDSSSSSTDHEYEFAPRGIACIPGTRGCPPSCPDLHTRTVTSTRLQRQLNVRLQSCQSHMRDIASLVEDMIANSEQCRLRSAPSRHRRPTDSGTAAGRHDRERLRGGGCGVGVGVSEDDEGFADMDDELGSACVLAQEEKLTLRRACAPSGVRKKTGLDAGCGRRSTGKVRSAPRLRRRKGICG
ncbi:hypothetical protein QTJ16_005195 [Diplocarpon rosae]|uniref:Uncharacterized protein n=1 Tax=Diplocarpon rosae TaxID=946125 RepID=A0AAD9SWJ1_9HELO|nr:hypothetical protein QTJ16_005195 [Diplocarpon rosae]